jgi:LemA protein
MTAIAIILGVATALPVIWLILIYNRFVKTRQHVRDSWAGIDVELKRRYDLIPNLVDTVKGYASHEKETLQQVIDLRNRAVASTGSAESQARDEQALLLGLRGLFARVEAYPQLKADTNFRMLQDELANTEDRIAAARRFYNGNVRDMNQLCQSFPTNLVAGLFGFGPETYFELSSEAERVVPRVAV